MIISITPPNVDWPSKYKHVNAFESLQENNQNVDLIVQQVRTSDDLKENIHGLVIPGGESTTIGHFLRYLPIPI